MEKTIEGGIVYFAELCEYAMENKILERSSLFEWEIPLKLLKIIMFLEKNPNGESRFRVDVNLSEIEEILLEYHMTFCDVEKKYVRIDSYCLDEPEARDYPHIRSMFVYLYMLEWWSKRTEFLWVFVLIPYVYRMQNNGIDIEISLESIDGEYPFSDIIDWVKENENKKNRELRVLMNSLAEEAEQCMCRKRRISNTNILYKYRIKDQVKQIENDFIYGFRMIEGYIRKNGK